MEMNVSTVPEAVVPEVCSSTAWNSLLRGSRTLPRRIDTVLETLREALEYARDLNVNRWEFAVEWDILRPFGVTPSDLRWLAGRGLIESGLEVTSPSSPQRSFQPCQQLVISQRSCFVLTDAGEELLANGRPPGSSRLVDLDWPSIAAPAEDSLKVTLPLWDHDRLELRWGATVLRQFKLPSADEERVLAAFEERGWPHRVGSPLPEDAGGLRLVDCVASLNWRQRRPLLRFGCSEERREVTWEFCPEIGNNNGH